MPRVMNVAVVGLGQSGRLYIELLKTFEAIDIVALVDPNEKEFERAEQSLHGRPKPRRYTTVENMLKHLGLKIDIVVVATPPNHRDMIFMLLEWNQRKIAVFCAAPLCLDASTAVKISTAIEQSKHIVVVDHWRTTYAMEKLKEYIDLIGEITRVTLFGQGGHAHRYEIVRSGRYLSVVFELAGAANDCYPVVSLNGGQNVIGYLTTLRGVPVVIDLQAGKHFDAGRLCIEWLGSKGRVRLMGPMLEQVYYTAHPFDSVSEIDFGVTGTWFQIPIHGDRIVSVRTKDLARANLTPLLNPSFANMKHFLALVRDEEDSFNPCPVAIAIPIARVLQTLYNETKK